MGIESKIQNSHLLTDMFGEFPSFHDAEVLRVTLERGDKLGFEPSLEALINTWQFAGGVDERGYLSSKNDVLVSFRFAKIAEVNLDGFNQQNVLFHLEIIELSEPAENEAKFKVVFLGCFGIEAEFYCDSISIESVEPYVRDES